MKAVAQELDREAQLGPVAVDLVAVAVDVRAWSRKTVLLQQREECILEGAERHVRAERASQLRDALLRRVARDARLDVTRRRAMVNPALVAGAAELCDGKARSEVEQHARDRGDPDGIEGRHVQHVKRPDAVYDDPRSPAARRRRNGDLGWRWRARAQPQRVRRRPVAQCRARAAGEHGRHVVGERRAPRMSDRVHAVVDAVQAAVLEPALDRVPVDARGNQLVPRHPAVLASRDAGGRGEVGAHTAAEATPAASSPPSARRTTSSERCHGEVAALSTAQATSAADSLRN